MRLMRLLNAETLELEEYNSKSVPEYAILSHRWQEEEVTFQDLDSPALITKKGYKKIKSACRLTLNYGLDYLWVDTCCIDKGSSIELAGAINSMYKWYAEAAVCFTYLCDVKLPRRPIKDSAWFKRGWTLQELIAPRRVHFYDMDWRPLGTKKDLTETLADATDIELDVLTGRSGPSSYSIAQRMSWAARRVTERIEDRAYSLLGLFDVNMPLLYGEGSKAFIRLQEEIIKHSDDQSIFAWDRGFGKQQGGRCGLLATSPSQFSGSRTIISPGGSLSEEKMVLLTNIGLSIPMRTVPWTMETFLALLNCSLVGRPGTRLGIFVERINLQSTEQQYARVRVKEVAVMVLSRKHLSKLSKLGCWDTRQIHVRRTTIYPSLNTWYGFYLKRLTLPGFTETQLSQAQVYTRNAAGRISHETSPLLSIPDGRCGTVAVWRMPHRQSNHNRIAWMQFGFDGDFAPWCRFGRRGVEYDYPNIEDFFDDRCIPQSHSDKKSWLKEGFLLLEGDRATGLRRDIRFLDTRIWIKRRRLPSFAASHGLKGNYKRVWTIVVEELGVTDELHHDRQRQKVGKGLGHSLVSAICAIALGIFYCAIRETP